MSDPQLYSRLCRRTQRESLSDSVADNLVNLMNHAARSEALPLAPDSQVANSVLNFGHPSLGKLVTTKNAPMRVAAHLGEVIRRFEPRVDPDQISVYPRSLALNFGPHTAYFDVHVRARHDGRPVWICLAFDYLGNYFFRQR
jgi:type VI secretion system protein ImpF